VVLADAPSDHAPGVDDLFRHGKESFADTQAIVAKVRERFPTSKIALVGTSAGTVSVGNALERDPNIADAFVLTSPVTVSRKGGGATISDELAAATPAVEEVCRSPPFRLAGEKVDQRGN
jgi:alpha-beta hydrolase superfamily lysophospholipase